MRAKYLGAVLAALIAPLAYAGELPSRGKISAATPAAADEPTQWNRSGVYLGLLGGYDTQVLEAEGLDLGSGKLMAGAMVGYNWRVSQGLVLGVEADWMFTGVSSSHTVDEVTLKATTDHLVSVRARAGIPVGPALLYVTGGPAWQQSKISLSAGEEGVSERTWQLGLAVGGGAEIEMSRSMALRLEAIHYVFPTDGAPLNELLDSENQHTTARAGLVWKLN